MCRPRMRGCCRRARPHQRHRHDRPARLDHRLRVRPSSPLHRPSADPFRGGHRPVSFNAELIEADRATGRALGISQVSGSSRSTTSPMRTPPPAPPIIAIVGPTAVGKSDLALALARTLPVEILVADSRQAYRGMDVGPAKPDAAARAAVAGPPIDLVAPDARFTLADWLAAARRAVQEWGSAVACRSSSAAPASTSQPSSMATSSRGNVMILGGRVSMPVFATRASAAWSPSSSASIRPGPRRSTFAIHGASCRRSNEPSAATAPRPRGHMRGGFAHRADTAARGARHPDRPRAAAMFDGGLVAEVAALHRRLSARPARPRLARLP